MSLVLYMKLAFLSRARFVCLRLQVDVCLVESHEEASELMNSF